jgi:hypothetical protein
MIGKMITGLYSNGKYMMFFGALCVIIGILVFCFFGGIQHYVRTERHPVILEWLVEGLGRNGLLAFFGGGGILVLVRGWLAARQQKNSADSAKTD